MAYKGQRIYHLHASGKRKGRLLKELFIARIGSILGRKMKVCLSRVIRLVNMNGLVLVSVVIMSFCLVGTSGVSYYEYPLTRPRSFLLAPDQQQEQYLHRLSTTRSGGRNRYRNGNENYLQQRRSYGNSVLKTAQASKIVNVDDFGAKADGRDDSKAFLNAWKEACSSHASDTILVVPKDKIYHLRQLNFSGPCNSRITFKIYGKLKASGDPSDYEKDRSYWLLFTSVNNLNVQGGGVIDGNGHSWWKNSCKINPNLPCKVAPTALSFLQCKGLVVDSLWLQNAQQMHLIFRGCINVIATNLLVTAPEDSPNTDGIHVVETQNIRISHCQIKTGDDCISIVSGSKNVAATYITCGPGHGISIGSLGAGNKAEYVSDIMVNKARLFGSTNGVRIKTWQGGSGYARNIKFQNVVMHNVTNPIIIDQKYCDQASASLCPEQRSSSAVEVSNVLYQNIKGTSATDVAIKYDCTNCRDIFVQDVSLAQAQDGLTKASCSNVSPKYIGTVSPNCNT